MKFPIHIFCLKFVYRSCLIFVFLSIGTQAIDLRCSTSVTHHDWCYIEQDNQTPLNNATEINFILPQSWTFAQIEQLTVSLADNPIPFPT